MYDKQTWHDGPIGGTPLSAARMQHIEDGIETLEQTTLPATYGAKAGGNTWTASQTMDVSSSRGSTPFWNFVQRGRSWQVGGDVVNSGGAQDFVLGVMFNERTVDDLVTTNSSTTVTSAAQALFGPNDNGRTITGPGIPNGTTLVWASGTDSLTSARLSAAATASATVSAVIGAGSTVTDVLYMSGNGGNYAAVGVGVTPPSKDYRLQVQGGGTGATSQGGLTIGQAASNTGRLINFADSGGTTRLYMDSEFSFRSAGNGAWGGCLVAKGDDTNNIPLVLVHRTSNSTWGTWWEDNSTLSLRFGGATQSVQFWGDGGFRMMGKVGFYGTVPVAQPTVTGSRGGNAALASLLTALASQGQLIDSSTA